MSRTRHIDAPLVVIAEPSACVTGVALDYPAGAEIPEHRHAEAQLIYAVSGVMTARTAAGQWVVPPQRAVWVPALEQHSIAMTGSVDMRTVYVRAEEAARLFARCTVVHVSPLLRELVLRIVDLPPRVDGDGSKARLVAVLLDELDAADQMPLHLPRPRDPRLLRITEALRKVPGDPRTLGEWSRSAGGSERTLARLFGKETGMTFGQWRQQARLLRALELLALGTGVTATALELGYDSPSAFIALFRRATGSTPGRYFGTRTHSAGRPAGYPVKAESPAVRR